MNSTPRPLTWPITLSAFFHLSAVGALFYLHPLWPTSAPPPQKLEISQIVVEEEPAPRPTDPLLEETIASEISLAPVATLVPPPPPSLPVLSEKILNSLANTQSFSALTLASGSEAVSQKTFISSPPTVVTTITNDGPGVVTGRPDYLRVPKPTYPRNALRHGWQGTTLLRVEISKNGDPVRVEIIQSSGYAELDEAAREAARAAKYVPEHRGEEAVLCQVEVPITFKLAGN